MKFRVLNYLCILFVVVSIIGNSYSTAVSRDFKLWQDFQCLAVRALSTGDVDGDGDVDVFVIAYDFEDTLIQGRAVEHTLYLPLFNDGRGSFQYGNITWDGALPLLSQMPRIASTGAYPLLVDVDSDGDLDLWLVTSSSFAGLGEADIVALNDGSGNFDTTNVIRPAVPLPQGVTLPPQLASLYGVPSHSAVVVQPERFVVTGGDPCVVYVNMVYHTSFGKLVQFQADNGRNYSHSIVASDVNGDGFEDIVTPATRSDVSGTGTTTVWLRNTSASGVSFTEISDCGLGSAVAVAFGSIFGSNFTDAVTIDRPVSSSPTASPIGGFIRLFRGNGTGIFEEDASSPILGEIDSFAGDRALGHSIHLADIDGDGNLDIISGQEEQGWGPSNQIWRGDGAGQFTFWRTIGPGGITRSVVIDDFNADGLVDIFVVNEDDEDTELPASNQPQPPQPGQTADPNWNNPNFKPKHPFFPGSSVWIQYGVTTTAIAQPRRMKAPPRSNTGGTVKPRNQVAPATHHRIRRGCMDFFPTQDTFIAAGMDSMSSFENSPELQVLNVATPPPPPKATLIYFNLSSIPAGKLTSATLSMYADGPGPAFVSVAQELENWLVTPFTSWTNKNSPSEPWNAGPEMSYNASTAVREQVFPGTTAQWNVSDIVSGWHEGTFPNYGFFVGVQPPDVGGMKFNSSQSGPMHHPRLRVCGDDPSIAPTQAPTNVPSAVPSKEPTGAPSMSPTGSPSVAPSSLMPTNSPSQSPSVTPSVAPTSAPSQTPTQSPTVTPDAPTRAPTTKMPSVSPSMLPSKSPTEVPSNIPTQTPTGAPSLTPTSAPSLAPTVIPTQAPSASPSMIPTVAPSNSPSNAPTKPPLMPTQTPTLGLPQMPTVTPGSPTKAPTPMMSSCFPIFSKTDTYITDGAQNRTSFHTSDTLIVRKQSFNPSSYSLLYFDLASYSGATVSQAQLRLWSSGNGAPNIGVAPVLKNWQVTNYTSYAEANVGDSWDPLVEVGFGQAVTAGVPMNAFANWDITAIVNEWLSGNQINDGLAVAVTSGEASLMFRSSEFSNQMRRPQLQLCIASTATPSQAPTDAPSSFPTRSPTVMPGSPTKNPTTKTPTATPTTATPSVGPTLAPTSSPTVAPTTQTPTVLPGSPTKAPTSLTPTAPIPSPTPAMVPGPTPGMMMSPCFNLRPDSDTYIVDGLLGQTSFHLSEQLEVSEQVPVSYALLYFDLSMFGPASPSSAQLRLVSFNQSGKVEVSPLLKNWTITPFTSYSEANVGDAWTFPAEVDGFNIVTSNVPSMGLAQWDVTSMVNDWITGVTPNFGFALSGEIMSGTSVMFRSNKASMSNMRPQLDVCFPTMGGAPSKSPTVVPGSPTKSPTPMMPTFPMGKPPTFSPTVSPGSPTKVPTTRSPTTAPILPPTMPMLTNCFNGTQNNQNNMQPTQSPAAFTCLQTGFCICPVPSPTRLRITGTLDGGLNETFGRPEIRKRVETVGHSLVYNHSSEEVIVCGGDSGFTLGQSWITIASRIHGVTGEILLTESMWINDQVWKRCLLSHDSREVFAISEAYPTAVLDFEKGTANPASGFHLVKLAGPTLVNTSVPVPFFWMNQAADTLGDMVLLNSSRIIISGTARASTDPNDPIKYLALASFNTNDMSLEWSTIYTNMGATYDSVRPLSDSLTYDSARNVIYAVTTRAKEGVLAVVAAVWKLNATDGTMLNSSPFEIDLGLPTVGTSVKVTKDGSLIVAGVAGFAPNAGGRVTCDDPGQVGSQQWLAKVMPSGSEMDDCFAIYNSPAISGIRQFQIGGFNAPQTLSRLEIDEHSRIIVGGALLKIKSYQWTLGRFLPDGQTDQTFGLGGVAVQEWGEIKGSVDSLFGDLMLVKGSAYTAGYEDPGLVVTKWSQLNIPSRKCGFGPDCICTGPGFRDCSIGEASNLVDLVISGPIDTESDFIRVYGNLTLTSDVVWKMEAPFLSEVVVFGGSVFLDNPVLNVTAYAQGVFQPIRTESDPGNTELVRGAITGGFRSIPSQNGWVVASSFQKPSCQEVSVSLLFDNVTVDIDTPEPCPVGAGFYAGIGLLAAALPLAVILLLGSKRAKMTHKARIAQDIAMASRTKALAGEQSTADFLGDRDLAAEREAKLVKRQRIMNVLRAFVIIIEVAAIGLLCYALWDFYEFKVTEGAGNSQDFFTNLQQGFSSLDYNGTDPGVRFLPPRSSEYWSGAEYFDFKKDATLDFDRQLFSVTTSVNTTPITVVLLVSLILDIIGLGLLIAGIILEILIYKQKISPRSRTPMCCGKRFDIFVWFDVLFAVVAVLLLGVALVIAFSNPVVIEPRATMRGVRVAQYDPEALFDGMGPGALTSGLSNLNVSVPASLECFFEAQDNCTCNSVCRYSSSVTIDRVSTLVRLPVLIQGDFSVVQRNVTLFQDVEVAGDLTLKNCTLIIFGRLTVHGDMELIDSRIFLYALVNITKSLSIQGASTYTMRNEGTTSINQDFIVQPFAKFTLKYPRGRLYCQTFITSSTSAIVAERDPQEGSDAIVTVFGQATLAGTFQVVLQDLNLISVQATGLRLLMVGAGNLNGRFDQSQYEMIDWPWYRQSCAFRDVYSHRLYTDYSRVFNDPPSEVCAPPISDSKSFKFFRVNVDVLDCTSASTGDEIQEFEEYTASPLDGFLAATDPAKDKFLLKEEFSRCKKNDPSEQGQLHFDPNQPTDPAILGNFDPNFSLEPCVAGELQFSFRYVSCRDAFGFREEKSWLKTLEVFPDWLWTICPKTSIFANEESQCHEYFCEGSMLVPRTLSEEVSKNVQDNVLQGITLDTIATSLGLLGVFIEHIIIRRMMAR